ncbi:MAG: Beta-barrel assembly-enhancing protease [Candidatus Omnitrophica bacterium]|nr:Beta-barrel assembly-enhancing protease [Candidatus Omnitrophota bacterium]
MEYATIRLTIPRKTSALLLILALSQPYGSVVLAEPGATPLKMTSAMTEADLPAYLAESAELFRDRRIRSEFNRAVAHKDAGRYDEAIDTLGGLLEEEPELSEVSRLLAWVHYLNGQHRESAHVARGILARDPSDAHAMRTLALTLRRQDKEREARKWLKRSLDADPNDTLAHLEMAESFRRHGEIDRALRHYTEALRIDPSLRSTRRIVAQLHDQAGHTAKAVVAYERALKLYPDDKSMRARLSLLRRKLPRRAAEPAAAPRVMHQPAHPKTSKIIRIGLGTDVRSAEFSFSSDFRIVRHGRSDGPLRRAGTRYRISAAGEGRLLIEAVSGQARSQDWVLAPARLESVAPGGVFTLYDVEAGRGDFWAKREDRSYRGDLELLASAGTGVTVINRIDLESYLYGVVPSEMSALWPEEALKAQAIAARSEALRKIARHAMDGYDLCAETHCQVYSGTSRETRKVCQLVDETAGRVLLHEGRPIDAVYSSSCGGHTQDNIYGAGEDVPYLRGSPDGAAPWIFPLSPMDLERWIKSPPEGIHCGAPIQAQPSRFRWVRVYSAEEMDQMAARIGHVGSVRHIEVVERKCSGHISHVRIVGTEGAVEIQKELVIRRALGDLRSSLFKVETRFDASGAPVEHIFFGGGWGHGVGMCQSGAAGRALAGQSAEEILAHYFRVSELTSAE